MVRDKVVRAAQRFELDRHHELIYDDPNELIKAGFPGPFLLPLIRIFQSSDGYKYHLRGVFVDEMIGISHAALIYAIARHLGVPPSMGSEFTGRGFAMRANIEAIRRLLTSARN